MRYVIIVERIEEHPAIAPVLDQMVLAQNTKLMGDGSAIDAGRERKVADTELPVAKRGQHALARLVAKHRKESCGFDVARDSKSRTRSAHLMRVNT